MKERSCRDDGISEYTAAFNLTMRTLHQTNLEPRSLRISGLDPMEPSTSYSFRIAQPPGVALVVPTFSWVKTRGHFLLSEPV